MALYGMDTNSYTFNIKNRLYGLKSKNTPKNLSSGGVDVVAANCKILFVTRSR